MSHWGPLFTTSPLQGGLPVPTGGCCSHPFPQILQRLITPVQQSRRASASGFRRNLPETLSMHLQQRHRNPYAWGRLRLGLSLFAGPRFCCRRKATTTCRPPFPPTAAVQRRVRWAAAGAGAGGAAAAPRAAAIAPSAPPTAAAAAAAAIQPPKGPTATTTKIVRLLVPSKKIP